MYSYVRTSETRVFFFYRHYAVTAKIEATPLELQTIAQHRLGRMEIFVDPARDRMDQAAASARDEARGLGLSVITPRGAGRSLVCEVRALAATVRACRAFRVTLADLLNGTTITHVSLRESRVIERVLITCIDEIDDTVRAAARYSGSNEDIYEPEGDEDEPPRPSRWLPRRRHGS